jgi:hypothetical protein
MSTRPQWVGSRIDQTFLGVGDGAIQRRLRQRDEVYPTHETTGCDVEATMGTLRPLEMSASGVKRSGRTPLPF